MACTSSSRSAQRQELVTRLAAALAAVVGSRLTIEPLDDKAVAVQLDGGEGGTVVTRIAPWLPAFTRRRDLLRTAASVADAVHNAASEAWPGATSLGPRPPVVSARNSRVLVQFFGSDDEPLPVVQIPTGDEP